MMIRRASMASPRRRGGVAVVVTLGLVPLIGVLAFAIDGGLLMASKRRSQTVVDAAAHAAACQLYSNILTDLTGLDVLGTARAAAFRNAAANGFTNDGTTNTVTVNIPPTSGMFANKPFYAEVLVTYSQPRIFGAVLGSGSLRIGARAVARGVTGGPTPYTTASIVALNASKAAALGVTGGVNLSADSPVQVDSASGTAFSATGGVNVTAPVFQVVGGYTKSGSNVNGTMSTGAPYIPDPLATLAPPDPSTLSQRSFKSTYGIATISPGVYTGGLSIQGGMIVTMAPGLYYMKGGNLSIANGVNLSGTGVTIFLDSGSKLDIQGGTNFSITPPTSGTWAGLSLYQDRTSTAPINLGNGANINIGGTIYAASAPLSVVGGSNVHAGSQVVVDSFNLSNGINLAFTTASDAKKGYVATRNGTPSIAIVE